MHFPTRYVPHCYFFGLTACEGANVTGIFDAIRKTIKFQDHSNDDIERKIVGVGDNGTSVNTRTVTGVITLMRDRISPWIIMVQYTPHRIELPFKDGIKVAHLYTKV